MVRSVIPARPAQTAVAIHPPLAERWSPSRFSATEEPTRDEILALLEAARWAPSAGNEQPWRFLLIPRAHPRREAVEGALRRGNAYARRAFYLIVVIAKLTRERGGDANRWAEHDVGIATGFLLVQATVLGVAAHPMAGWEETSLRAALEIPAEFRPTAVIAVGVYDPELHDEGLEERETRPRTRRPLGEIAYYGTLGEEPIGGQ